MDGGLRCEIVKDLMPLYVDGMVSDVSRGSVEEHLAHCAECKEVYQNMVYDIEMEKRPSEVQDVKRFLKKTKNMYLSYGLGILSLVAMLVCMIVDLAINRGITWSLIVGTAVMSVDALVYVLSACKKDKGIIAMAVMSIGTACLLFVVQITRYYLMGAGTFWIFRYGVPILLLWLGVLWVPVLLRRAFKWGIWDQVAVFMLLVIAGNYVTRLITGDYVWEYVCHMRALAGNALGVLIGSAVFWFSGRVKKWRR